MTDVSAEPVRELLTGRTVQLGESTQVRRLLPNLGRRMVGAWCFVDHYGPDDIADEPGMQVPPHPHMGLQTVSWLHEGEVLHRDSLGSLQTVRPRELGLMTSGRAIAHSEESPRDHARYPARRPAVGRAPGRPPPHRPRLRAPRRTARGHRRRRPARHRDPRRTRRRGLPGTAYTPLVGADLTLAAGTDARLPLEPDFEYAVLAMSGEADVDGVRVPPGSLLYLGCGRTELPLRADSDSWLMLLGGEPFEEEIVMWWNFVGRTGDEIAAARADVERRWWRVRRGARLRRGPPAGPADAGYAAQAQRTGTVNGRLVRWPKK